MHTRFDETNFKSICNILARRDKDLRSVLQAHDYPPMWVRPARFSTLILTILEQQVSLASAYAAYKKLKAKIRYVTPERFLVLSDEELRSCYFSRQKIIYTRELANAVLSGKLVLKMFHTMQDENVRVTLKAIKGIGDWTADIYLIHALRRTDIFPTGDLALIKGIKEVKKLPVKANVEDIIKLAEHWRPYRSIATMIFWHHYIKSRNIRIAQ